MKIYLYCLTFSILLWTIESLLVGDVLLGISQGLFFIASVIQIISEKEPSNQQKTLQSECACGRFK